MANRTVEFISDQYGKMVFANAASESTMRELLNAIGDLEDNIDDGSVGGPASPVVNSVKKSGNKIKGLASKVEKWGRTTTKDFANLMEKGSNKTSEWATAVNDNFVKEIPIVGEALGGLADSLITAISIFEGWNDVLAQTSKSGASFNNSILELRKSAALAHMDLEVFASVVKKNSEQLVAIGGTVSKGAKIFSAYNRQLWEGKNSVAKELLNLGFTSDEIGRDFMFYFTNIIRGNEANKNQYKKQADSFAEYAKNQQFITMMTGKTAEQQQQGMMESLKNENFRRHLDTLSEGKRKTTLRALTWADSIFKDAGRDYVMASSMGQKEMADLGNKLATYSPNSKKMLDELIELANSTSDDVEAFDERSKDIIAKYIPLLNSDMNALKEQLDNTSVGADGLEDLVKTTEGVREFLNNFGAVNNMTTEQIKARIKQIQDEAKKRETFTQAMNEMSATIRKFKDEVMVDLVPYFEQIGEVLKQYDIPKKIEAYGKSLEKLFTQTYESISWLFRYFNSDESDAFVKAYMELFARKMYLYAKLGVLKMSPVPTGWLQDRVRREIEETEKSQAALPSIAALGQPDTTGIVRIVTPDGNTVTVARADLYKRIAEYAKQDMEIANIDVIDGQMVVALRKRPGFWERMTRNNVYKIDKGQGEPVRAIIDGLITYRTFSFGSATGVGATIVSKDGKVKAEYMTIGDSQTAVQGTSPPQSNAQFLDMFNGKEIKAGQVIGGYSTIYPGLSMGGPLSPTRPKLEVTKDDGSVETYNKGTLGEYGKLFRNFGSGTLAVLHNEEAVTTPAQQSSLMTKAGQFIAAEFIVNLNSNVKTLISLTKEELDFERAKVRALASARVN